MLLVAKAALVAAAATAVLTPHQAHVLHEHHLAVVAERQAGTSTVTASRVSPGYATHYSYAGLEALWEGAGGPAWAAPRAARIAICESGGNIYAHNPSGASGLWQILGLPFAGNPFNPYTNARMAVSKFRSAGNSFAPWVCQ